MQISKQAAQAIESMERSRVAQQCDERTKRQITENQDAIEFWIATARHWHKRATFLEGVAQREKDTTMQAVTEMTAQAMERDHFRSEAERCHADTMAAERRTDSLADIMEALSRGYVMPSFDGCARWWRFDTDTLAEVAKAAREWQDVQDSQPAGPDCQPITEVVAIGKADGEEFQIGGTLYKHADPESENLIALANHMRSSLDGLPDEWQAWAAEIEQSIRKAAFTTATAIGNAWLAAQPKPCECQAYPILGHETPAETQSGHNRLAHATGLILQLSNYHDGRNTWLMNYAEHRDPDVQAMIRRQPSQVCSEQHAIDLVAQQPGAEHAADPVQERKADGFNGHMIGTDGDRVGFIKHAINYGFEPEIGPLERLGSSALGDLYSAAFYYMQNNGHPLKVTE